MCFSWWGWRDGFLGGKDNRPESIYRNYLEFFCMRKFVYSPHLFIQSLIYGFVNIYFMSWVLMQYSTSVLLRKLLQLWPYGDPSLAVFSCHIPIILACVYTLQLGALKHSQDIVFPASALKVAVSPRNPGSFYWKNGIRSQDLGIKVCSLLLGVITSELSHNKKIDIWVCTNLCVHIYKYFHM